MKARERPAGRLSRRSPSRHERAERRPAQPQCPLEHRVEHRRQIAGRGVDHLSTSAVAVCCSSASAARSKSVLDRDHRLIGKRADEFYLTVGERLDALAGDMMSPMVSLSRRGHPATSLLGLTDIRDSRARQQHRECARCDARCPTDAEPGRAETSPVPWRIYSAEIQNSSVAAMPPARDRSADRRRKASPPFLPPWQHRLQIER